MGRYAQTVTGRVPAGALGPALMHEHLLCDLRDPRTRQADTREWPPITISNRFEIDYFQNRHRPNMLLDEDDVAIRELAHLSAAGGSTVAELTTGGLSPQPQRLARIATAGGVNIIMGAGYYTEAYLPDEVRTAATDALEAAIVGQLTDGAWGTPVRAGIIGEIGCSWPLAGCERRMLVATARAQRATGAAITIHPGRHPDAPAEIADVLVEAGAEPTSTVIGHIDRTIFDRDRLVALLSRGFVLEWDFFGIETSQYWMAGEDLDLPTDYMRLDLIGDLIGCGFAGQIVISHDICTRTRLTAYGGHGYRHILAHVVPMMRRRGFAEQTIETLLVETPARLLGYLSEPDPPPGSQPAERSPGAAGRAP